MVNAVVLVVILIIVSLSVHTIVKEKKKGVHCIGCPSSGSCSKCKCSEDTNK